MSVQQSVKSQRVRLLPQQDHFIFARKKFTAFIGGVGSGKTWAGCVKALIHSHDDVYGAIVAPTYPMLRDVTQATLLGILDDAESTYEFIKSEGILRWNGAQIYLRSADQPERLRGLNLDWAYLDEAALMREKVWKIILGRLRRGTPLAWITTTPAGFNWVYRQFVESHDPKYGIVQASTRDNTYLPGEYLDDLLTNYSGDFAAQEIDGQFIAFEGLVFSEFRQQEHVVEPFEIPASWTIVRGIDFGYTNPFVCLWGAVDEDGRLYIIDEHYRRKTLIDEHAQAIKSRQMNVLWTVADHDAQGNAELASKGVVTQNADKAVLEGIQRVAARLQVQEDGAARLHIFSNCVNLIKEFGQYHWSEVKEGRNEKEEPVKENDHAMDALRYMIMRLDKDTGPRVRVL